MPVSHRVLALLATITEDDQVLLDPDIRLYETELLDSMRTVELLAALARELGIRVPLSEISRDRWATPALIVHYIESKLGVQAEAV